MPRLQIHEKLSLLKRHDEGASYSTLVKEFNISKSSISDIVKTREKIELFAANNENNLKRSRINSFPIENQSFNELESKVHEWYLSMKNDQVSVTGSMLQNQASLLSNDLDIGDFKASDGWLRSFKKKFHIGTQQSGVDEVTDVDLQSSEENYPKISEILLGYQMKDVFTSSETCLFWRAIPDKSLNQLCEHTKLGHYANERVTVLLTVSSMGEKLRPLIIGKSTMPRSFNGHIPLGIDYHSDSKAWMTKDIFSKYLDDLNTMMIAQQRHILLLLDNSPCHFEYEQSNVKAVFLDGQNPFDLGIIKSFKLYYRKLLLEYFETEYQKFDKLLDISKQLTLAISIKWIKLVWTEYVKESTIMNCFRICKISNHLNSSIRKIEYPLEVLVELASRLYIDNPVFLEEQNVTLITDTTLYSMIEIEEEVVDLDEFEIVKEGVPWKKSKNTMDELYQLLLNSDDTTDEVFKLANQLKESVNEIAMNKRKVSDNFNIIE